MAERCLTIDKYRRDRNALPHERFGRTSAAQLFLCLDKAPPPFLRLSPAKVKAKITYPTKMLPASVPLLPAHLLQARPATFGQQLSLWQDWVLQLCCHFD
ncbi:hypothetical protein IE81DRAFT_345329 [Ceraceosorus guamensis]|uniref:Uncharacterized protein n=1 Tax=Ceraceosorus guamensis TaxID=1522189 RepID=A0A316W7C4_9BASI|nr:hypothetical protein IE81DRAFT_345329 [Ceraceosorus guamensis]PWN44631.1 hypothetical protein IE81DRAFT_345329 [Ceraceosorus guamensis]